MNRLICGDIIDLCGKIDKKFDCCIADPPDNLGLKYKNYKDNLSEKEYIKKLESWIYACGTLSNICWMSFNARYVFKVGVILESQLFQEYEARLFIQHFTFGQNNRNDCGNGYRPILRLKHKDAKLYPDTIKVPSWRQLNGDSRAAEGGKVPLDSWTDFPRVTGNSKQRREWHPTQLHEGLIQRMVNLSCPVNGTVLDAFSGTGTVLRAIKDRYITSVELDEYYCKQIALEHGLNIEYGTRIRKLK